MDVGPEPHPSPHLLVVDDHDLVRLGLRSLVQSCTESLETPLTVLEARNLQEARTLYQMHGARIGMVLLDLHLPDAHGLSGLKDFLGRFPDARVVVLSGVNDPALMRQALARGAQAFLPKSDDLENVVVHVRSMFVPGQAWPKMPAAELAVHAGGSAHTQPLSTRQQQMPEWVLAGRSNREIAEAAHLSEGTVKNHVSALLLIFGVRSRAQLMGPFRSST